jgi:hypothetical protein
MTKNSTKDQWAWLADITGPLDEDFVAAALEEPDQQQRPDYGVLKPDYRPQKPSRKPAVRKTK